MRGMNDGVERVAQTGLCQLVSSRGKRQFAKESVSVQTESCGEGPEKEREDGL